MAVGRLLALFEGLGVDLVEFRFVDLLAVNEIGLAHLADFDLLEHLADNHLDVLVVDVDALEPIDFLDLVDQIRRQLFDALDRQDVVRCRVALDDVVALLDDVTVLQMDVLTFGNEILPRLLALHARLDAEAALVLVIAAEPDGAGNFRDDGSLLRPPRLEQLGNPRKAARDVTGLGAFARHAGDDVAGLHVTAGIDREDGVDRKQIAGLASAA